MIKRFLASALSLIYLATNVVLLHSAETNVWNERRHHSSPVNQETQLAGVPASFSASHINSADIIRQLPDLRTKGTELSLSSPKNEEKIPPVFDTFLKSIPLEHGAIKEIHLNKNIQPSSPFLVLLQDVHLNTEAQGNLASILEAFNETASQLQTSLVVGIEGAFGPFDFQQFHAFQNQTLIAALADEFLEKNKIGAPSYAGLLAADSAIKFIGIDDHKHYQANLEAYRKSLPIQNGIYSFIEKVEKRREAEKGNSLNPALHRYEQRKLEFLRGEMGYADYVARLAEDADDLGETLDLNIEQFMSAYNLEKSMDFGKVEKERASVIQALVNKVSSEELEGLAKAGIDFQMGRIGFADYYRDIKRLIDRRGVTLSSSPAFDSYIKYVLLSDGIDVDSLIESVDRLERAVLDHYAENPREKQWMQESEALSLVSLLVHFALTPEEWDRYKTLPKSIFISLGLKERDLKPFEDFYQEADYRSHSMMANLLKEKSSMSVLVAGGFHTPQLGRLLKEEGYSYVIVQPKVSEVVESGGTEYLSIFAREKMPLDRLFSGEKLFLAPAGLALGSLSKEAAPVTREFAAVAGGISAHLSGRIPSGTGVEFQSNVGEAVRIKVNGVDVPVYVGQGRLPDGVESLDEFEPSNFGRYWLGAPRRSLFVAARSLLSRFSVSRLLNPSSGITSSDIKEGPRALGSWGIWAKIFPSLDPKFIIKYFAGAESILTGAVFFGIYYFLVSSMVGLNDYVSLGISAVLAQTFFTLMHLTGFAVTKSDYKGTHVVYEPGRRMTGSLFISYFVGHYLFANMWFYLLGLGIVIMGFSFPIGFMAILAATGFSVSIHWVMNSDGLMLRPIGSLILPKYIYEQFGRSESIRGNGRGTESSQDSKYIPDKETADVWWRHYAHENNVFTEGSTEYQAAYQFLRERFDKLLLAAGINPTEIRFFLTDKEEANAFATKGYDVVAVNLDLIRLLVDNAAPAESLDFVLAHEIVHLLQFRADIDSGKVRPDGDLDDWIYHARDMINKKIEDYADEYDADLRALELMQKAGFSIQWSPVAFELLLSGKKSSHMSWSHPAMVERVRRLKLKIRDVLQAEYYQRTDFTSEIASELAIQSRRRRMTALLEERGMGRASVTALIQAAESEAELLEILRYVHYRGGESVRYASELYRMIYEKLKTSFTSEDQKRFLSYIFEDLDEWYTEDPNKVLTDWDILENYVLKDLSKERLINLLSMPYPYGLDESKVATFFNVITRMLAKRSDLTAEDISKICAALTLMGKSVHAAVKLSFNSRDTDSQFSNLFLIIDSSISKLDSFDEKDRHKTVTTLFHAFMDLDKVWHYNYVNSDQFQKFFVVLRDLAKEDPIIRDAIIMEVSKVKSYSRVKRYFEDYERENFPSGTLIQSLVPMDQFKEASQIFIEREKDEWHRRYSHAAWGKIIIDHHGKSLTRAGLMEKVVEPLMGTRLVDPWMLEKSTYLWDLINYENDPEYDQFIDDRVSAIALKYGFGELNQLSPYYKRLIYYYSIGGYLSKQELLNNLTKAETIGELEIFNHVFQRLGDVFPLKNLPSWGGKSSWEEYAAFVGFLVLRIKLSSEISVADVWPDHFNEDYYAFNRELNTSEDQNILAGKAYQAHKDVTNWTRHSNAIYPEKLWESLTHDLRNSQLTYDELVSLIEETLPPSVIRNFMLFAAFRIKIMEELTKETPTNENWLDPISFYAEYNRLTEENRITLSTARSRIIPLLIYDKEMEDMNKSAIRKELARPANALSGNITLPADYEETVSRYDSADRYTFGGRGAQVDIMLAGLDEETLRDQIRNEPDFALNKSRILALFGRPSLLRDSLFMDLSSQDYVDIDQIKSLFPLYESDQNREQSALGALDRHFSDVDYESISFQEELAIIQEYFPQASAMRDELLLQAINKKATTPKEVAAGEKFLLRESRNIRNLKSAQYAFGEDVFREWLMKADAPYKKDFLLWLFGLGMKPDFVKKFEMGHHVNLDSLKEKYTGGLSQTYPDAGRRLREDFLRPFFGGENGLLAEGKDREEFLSALFEAAFPKNGNSEEENKQKNVYRILFFSIFKAGSNENIDDLIRKENILLSLLEGLGHIKSQGDGLTSKEKEQKILGLTLKTLGVVGVKAGQIMKIEGLDDKAKPLYKGVVMEMIRNIFGEFDAKFESIEEELGSASIKVVYKVRLNDGRVAVLKVKRPDIEKVIDLEIGVLREVLAIAKPELEQLGVHLPRDLVSQIERKIKVELDFENEIENQRKIVAQWKNRNISKSTWFSRTYPQIKVPDPDHTENHQNHLMLEDFVEGVSLDKKSDIESRNINYDRLLRILSYELFKQIFIYGFYHADLHKGNVRITKDGQVYIIDWGAAESIGRYQRVLLWGILISLEKSSVFLAALILFLFQPSQVISIMGLLANSQFRAILRSNKNSAEKMVDMVTYLNLKEIKIPETLEVLNLGLSKTSYLFGDGSLQRILAYAKKRFSIGSLFSSKSTQTDAFVQDIRKYSYAKTDEERRSVVAEILTSIPLPLGVGSIDVRKGLDTKEAITGLSRFETGLFKSKITDRNGRPSDVISYSVGQDLSRLRASPETDLYIGRWENLYRNQAQEREWDVEYHLLDGDDVPSLLSQIRQIQGQTRHVSSNREVRIAIGLKANRKDILAGVLQSLRSEDKISVVLAEDVPTIRQVNVTNLALAPSENGLRVNYHIFVRENVRLPDNFFPDDFEDKNNQYHLYLLKEILNQISVAVEITLGQTKLDDIDKLFQLIGSQA